MAKPFQKTKLSVKTRLLKSLYADCSTMTDVKEKKRSLHRIKGYMPKEWWERFCLTRKEWNAKTTEERRAIRKHRLNFLKNDSED